MEDQCHANPPSLTTKEQQARRNPEYSRLQGRITHWRAQLNGRAPLGQQTPEGLKLKIQHALKDRQHLCRNLPRQVIQYCRYADDYVVILGGYAKSEAVRLKQGMVD